MWLLPAALSAPCYLSASTHFPPEPWKPSLSTKHSCSYYQAVRVHTGGKPVFSLGGDGQAASPLQGLKSQLFDTNLPPKGCYASMWGSLEGDRVLGEDSEICCGHFTLEVSKSNNLVGS